MPPRIYRSARPPALAAAATLAAAAFGLGVLGAEAAAAARRRYLPADSAPDLADSYGDPAAPLLRLAVLGDSTAAGVGAGAGHETVAASLAAALAADGRRVEMVDVAVSGSRAGDLGPQVSRALLGRPDIAVILVGANDATGLTPLSVLRADLQETVGRLRQAAVPVVVGTCPDLGAARALAQPLRALAGMRGRRVAAASGAAVRAAGGIAVDLGARTGAAFRADPATLSSDAYHPSAEGYRLWTEALLPAVKAVLAVRLPS